MYVLKRAALLIQELAGGKITGAVQDVYPAVAEPYTVEVTYEKINTLIGKDIPVETVKIRDCRGLDFACSRISYRCAA